MSLFLEQTLPLSYQLGNPRQLLLFQKVAFVFRDISIIFWPGTQQQQKLDSDSLPRPLQTLMVGFIQSPPSRSAPNQQMVSLCTAAGFIPLHPLLPSRERAHACVRVCVCRNIHDFHLPFNAFCFSPPKSEKLGALSSNEPRCPAVIHFLSQSPCWSGLHSLPQIKELSRGPVLSVGFGGVATLGEPGWAPEAANTNVKLFPRFAWPG